MFNQQDLDKIEKAVKDLEQHTSAEIVTVLAARSDDYRYIPLLWAALLTLLLPVFLHFVAPIYAELLLNYQLVVFCFLSACITLTPLRIRCVPNSVRQWRASNMACRQFLLQSLHHTKDRTGFLIFVSEDEHYVEILADEGIAQRIDNMQWQSIVDKLIEDVRNKRALEGFVTCIESCGVVLKEHFPPSPDDVDELPNKLITVGYD